MELVYFQIIDRQAGIHPGQTESKHTIGRWLDKALFLTTSDVCCNETTGCISLKFMTTLLIFIFKWTNQVFPQVVSRLATSFSSIYFTDHCHYRGTLGLKVYIFPWNWQSELVFSTTLLLLGLFNWSISLHFDSLFISTAYKGCTHYTFLHSNSFNRTRWLIFKFRTTNIWPIGNWNPTSLTQSPDLVFTYVMHINIKRINYFLPEIFSPFKDQKMLTPINTFESEAITQERRIKRKKWMDDETGSDISPVCVPCSISHTTFPVLEAFVHGKIAIEREPRQKKVPKSRKKYINFFIAESNNFYWVMNGGFPLAPSIFPKFFSQFVFGYD